MSKERELLKRWLGDGLLYNSVYISLLEDTKELLAEPEKEPLDVQELKAGLFEHIKHGDEEHQRWLLNTINNFDFCGTAPKKRKRLSDEEIYRGFQSSEILDISLRSFIIGVEFAEREHGVE